MKKIIVSRDTANAYFYAEGEEYFVVNGTAMAWEVAVGEHKGRMIAHGHSKVIQDAVIPFGAVSQRTGVMEEDV